MNKNKSIQLKAALLLVVFALNTVVGFSCSIGMDMGFNHKHQHEEASEAKVHVHKDGQQHVHHEEKESHYHNNASNHNLATRHHKSCSGKNNCCNGPVKAFNQLEKSRPDVVSITNPVFFTVCLSSFLNIAILPPASVIKDIKPFVRSYHPPIDDIRVAIQSFQI